MDKVVLDRDAQDTAVAGYTHEGGGLYYDLISMKRTNSYYYLFDGLGSVTELLDSNEATQNSYRYEAFGQIKSSSENVTNYYKYVGAYGVHHESALALYFMQARYYQAGVGRFISRDPFGGVPRDPASLHRYLYVQNKPAVYVDPTGNFAWIIPIIGLPIIGAGWLFAGGYCANYVREWVNDSEDWDNDNVRVWDLYQHCVVECMITRECGRSVAWLVMKQDHRGMFDEAEHQAADRAGIDAGLKPRPPCPGMGPEVSDCKSGCAQAGYPPNGGP